MYSCVCICLLTFLFVALTARPGAGSRRPRPRPGAPRLRSRGGPAAPGTPGGLFFAIVSLSEIVALLFVVVYQTVVAYLVYYVPLW